MPFESIHGYVKCRVRAISQAEAFAQNMSSGTEISAKGAIPEVRHHLNWGTKDSF